ncbi:N-succinylarginine dihydrolase [Plesiomonas shigelloides]|uniref:N-succinylarginine dihydrolase n=1 Tax=Plesiomonas shigelloides TaxID=703 RepID=UPI002246C710|nr:N-succinylarginine dihydrolase [Plesiomonas shigelloides]MCX2496803.1 N-succinylarginine dihydrolase [Plesiomonas shigelloides]
MPRPRNTSCEINFDGLVGPTHNYAGLSAGNIASTHFAHHPSNPRQAALQGLEKMRLMLNLGLAQGILPPHERPLLSALRHLGFSGSRAQILEKAYQYNPRLLAAVTSASSMWAANAATVTPSADSHDGKVHFTPANLLNKFHRSLESETTARILRAVFADDKYFTHHPALPPHDMFSDEGAANHTRICPTHGMSGLHIFVYGRSFFDESRTFPHRFPARQTLEASQAIARQHGLDHDNAIFIQQNPQVIDQGVFHNDVIAVGNENVLFYHQQAFLATESLKQAVTERLSTADIAFIEVPEQQVSVTDAVQSYLFNSQLVTLPDQSMALIAPYECQEHPVISAYLQALPERYPRLSQITYLDLRQSMQNGGGPACLRLRVVLTADEMAAVQPHCLLDNAKIDQLTHWVNKHYRDRLTLSDLRDPALLDESCRALDELTQMLHLGSLYRFQQVGHSAEK